MSSKLGITRRQFIIGTASIAGGVAIGTYLFSEKENPLSSSLKPGEFAITPFVKITGEQITLIAPRADVGQGIASMQAYLIAEELDINPHDVVIDPGQPHPEYVNTVIASNSLPFHPLDDGAIPSTIKELMAKVAKLSGAQFTGGSSSVTDLHERLRLAGAIARESLKETAAQHYGLPRSSLNTLNGHILFPDGSELSYCDLVKMVSTLRPVKDISLRSPGEWKYLGKSIQRTDIVAKSTGSQTYGIDVILPNMLYATLISNPGRGGGLGEYSAPDISTMPGVVSLVELTDGLAVVANNTWRAIKASKLISVKWPSPDYPSSSEEMWKVLESAHNEQNIDSRLRDDGDVEKALSNRESVIAAEYRTPFLAHAALEPLSATVLVEDNNVTIWTATQVPHAIKDVAARITSLPKDNVTIHVLHAGGSFGRRLDHDYVIQAIEVANSFNGTPIKVTLSREEDMRRDFPRPFHMSKARGAVSDGKVIAFDMDTISPSLSSSWFSRVFIVPPGPDTLLVWGAYDQPYAIPNYRVTGYRAPELVPIGSWRSPGACSNAFFHESFLSELILKAGADPLIERIRLTDDPISIEVLKRVGEISNWQGNKGFREKGRGRGLAFSHSHHVAVAQVVDVTVTDAGIRIDDVWVVADCGTVYDPINAEAQLSGATIWGLGHAMNCELTYENHATVQTNFNQFQGMRLKQTPRIHVDILSNNSKVLGLGEPGTSPAAPALADAIHNATGKRIRTLPLNKEVNFA